MAIAFNNAADLGNNGGAGTLTSSYTVGSGANRLLIVALAGDVGGGADDITVATYAGAAMTLLAKVTPTSSPFPNRETYFYYKLNPASGANNVVISSTANHFLIAGAADYTGVAQSGQPDASTTDLTAAAASTLTTSLTTVADNCWVFLVEQGFNGNPPPSAGAGATLRTSDASFGAWGIFDSNGVVHPAGSYSMTTTRSSSVNPICHVVGSFAPAGGGTIPYNPWPQRGPILAT